MMPLLILVLLGMIEFGWGMAQQIDVRHKAREGLRLAIVDEPVDAIDARGSVLMTLSKRLISLSSRLQTVVRLASPCN